MQVVHPDLLPKIDLPDINWPVLLKVPVIMGEVEAPLYKVEFRLSERGIHDLIDKQLIIPPIGETRKLSQIIIDIIAKKKSRAFTEFVRDVARQYQEKLISLGVDLDYNFLDVATLAADEAYRDRLQHLGLGDWGDRLYQVVEVDWMLQDMSGSGNGVVYCEFFTKRDIRITATKIEDKR